MCLGIPGRVVTMLDGYEGQLALVDVAGEQRKVNVGMLAGLSKDFETRMFALEKEIHILAGADFNVGSPKQLGEILF